MFQTVFEKISRKKKAALTVFTQTQRELQQLQSFIANEVDAKESEILALQDEVAQTKVVIAALGDEFTEVNHTLQKLEGFLS